MHCFSISAKVANFIFQIVLIGMHVVYILSSKVLYNFCSHPSVAVMDAQQKREARLSRRRERERRLRASDRKALNKGSYDWRSGE